MKYLFSLLILLSSSAFANITLPAVLTSNMVLQQNAKVKFWGWGSPGEKVFIKPSWNNTTDSVTVNSEAKWTCTLQTPKAGGPYTIELKGYNMILLSDILIGEVWLCSGQSNMEMSVNWGLNYSDELLGAGNQNIRFFQVTKATSAYPQEDLKATWQISSSAAVRTFSALACFFAKKLEQELKVPIGVINSSWGGSPAEVWTPSDIVLNDSLLRAAAQKLNPSSYSSITPGANYNAMIHPLLNYTVAGVLWYQGETNVGQTSYDRLLKQMISSWRSAWNNNFPFYYVQIAPWEGYGSGIFAPLLRESQGKILALPGTGMVLSSDLVNDIKDIHPKMKKELGERLANYALAATYGVKVPAYKSPVFREMKIRKGKAIISFDNLNSDLVSKSGQLKEFYIAGDDKVFFPARGKVIGKSVQVWNESVLHPVAVRYGFTGNAQADLFSKEGLPVDLFRTDNWDVPTVQN